MSIWKAIHHRMSFQNTGRRQEKTFFSRDLPESLRWFKNRKKNEHKGRRHFVFVITIFMTNKTTEFSSSSLSASITRLLCTQAPPDDFPHPPLHSSAPFSTNTNERKQQSRCRAGENWRFMPILWHKQKGKKRETQPFPYPIPPHVLFFILVHQN